MSVQTVEGVLEMIRARAVMLAIVLLACLALLLWLSPAEQTLGQIVKLVYLHGALVRTAALLLVISLPINLVALVEPRSAWALWGKALVGTIVIVWLLHTLFSMVTTYAAWGVPIAWFEPRTRFTFAFAGGLLAMLAVVYIVADDRFTHAVFAALAGIALLLMPRLGVIQHPLNPIGTSPSVAIRAFYVGILLVSLALAGLLVIELEAWLHARLPPR